MWNTWERLCQASVDSYDKHPAKSNVITVVYLAVVVVVTVKVAQRVGQKYQEDRTRSIKLSVKKVSA
jgi:hypothetical protein